MHVGVLSFALVRRLLHIFRIGVVFILFVKSMVKISFLMIKQRITVKVVIFEVVLTSRGIEKLRFTWGSKSFYEISRCNQYASN